MDATKSVNGKETCLSECIAAVQWDEAKLRLESDEECIPSLLYTKIDSGSFKSSAEEESAASQHTTQIQFTTELINDSTEQGSKFSTHVGEESESSTHNTAVASEQVTELEPLLFEDDAEIPQDVYEHLQVINTEVGRHDKDKIFCSDNLSIELDNNVVATHRDRNCAQLIAESENNTVLSEESLTTNLASERVVPELVFQEESAVRHLHMEPYKAKSFAGLEAAASNSYSDEVFATSEPLVEEKFASTMHNEDECNVCKFAEVKSVEQEYKTSTVDTSFAFKSTSEKMPDLFEVSEVSHKLDVESQCVASKPISLDESTLKPIEKTRDTPADDVSVGSRSFSALMKMESDEEKRVGKLTGELVFGAALSQDVVCDARLNQDDFQQVPKFEDSLDFVDVMKINSVTAVIDSSDSKVDIQLKDTEGISNLLSFCNSEARSDSFCHESNLMKEESVDAVSERPWPSKTGACQGMTKHIDRSNTLEVNKPSNTEDNESSCSNYLCTCDTPASNIDNHCLMDSIPSLQAIDHQTDVNNAVNLCVECSYEDELVGKQISNMNLNGTCAEVTSEIPAFVKSNDIISTPNSHSRINESENLTSECKGNSVTNFVECDNASERKSASLPLTARLDVADKNEFSVKSVVAESLEPSTSRTVLENTEADEPLGNLFEENCSSSVCSRTAAVESVELSTNDSNLECPARVTEPVSCAKCKTQAKQINRKKSSNKIAHSFNGVLEKNVLETKKNEKHSVTKVKKKGKKNKFEVKEECSSSVQMYPVTERKILIRGEKWKQNVLKYKDSQSLLLGNTVKLNEEKQNVFGNEVRSPEVFHDFNTIHDIPENHLKDNTELVTSSATDNNCLLVTLDSPQESCKVSDSEVQANGSEAKVPEAFDSKREQSEETGQSAHSSSELIDEHEPRLYPVCKTKSSVVAVTYDLAKPDVVVLNQNSSVVTDTVVVRVSESAEVELPEQELFSSSGESSSSLGENVTPKLHEQIACHANDTDAESLESDMVTLVDCSADSKSEQNQRRGNTDILDGSVTLKPSKDSIECNEEFTLSNLWTLLNESSASESTNIDESVSVLSHSSIKENNFPIVDGTVQLRYNEPGYLTSCSTIDEQLPSMKDSCYSDCDLGELMYQEKCQCAIPSLKISSHLKEPNACVVSDNEDAMVIPTLITDSANNTELVNNQGHNSPAFSSSPVTETPADSSGGQGSDEFSPSVSKEASPFHSHELFTSENDHNEQVQTALCLFSDRKMARKRISSKQVQHRLQRKNTSDLQRFLPNLQSSLSKASLTSTDNRSLDSDEDIAEITDVALKEFCHLHHSKFTNNIGENKYDSRGSEDELVNSGLVGRWEAVHKQASSRQLHSQRLHALCSSLKQLHLRLDSLQQHYCSPFEGGKECDSQSEQDTNRHLAAQALSMQQLMDNLTVARERENMLSAIQKELSELNMRAHIFSTEICFQVPEVQQQMQQLYRLADHLSKCVSEELSSLTNAYQALEAWQQQADELRACLQQDDHTLSKLQQAVEGGPASLARLQQETSKAEGFSNTARSLATILSQTSVGSSARQCVGKSRQSDSGTSGYESCSSDDLCERERKLHALKRLAQELQHTLHPHALTNMQRTIAEAENNLLSLKRRCRELLQKTAKSVLPCTAAVRSCRRRGPPQRRALRSPSRGGVTGRRGLVWRVVRYSLPIQTALLLLCFLCYLLAPSCCDTLNTLNLDLGPQVRYIHGLPPV